MLLFLFKAIFVHGYYIGWTPSLEFQLLNNIFIFRITSPLLLIAIAVFLGACYIIHIKNDQQKIKIMGQELSYAQQYGVAALLSFPLFFLAGAGASVFWVLGKLRIII